MTTVVRTQRAAMSASATQRLASGGSPKHGDLADYNLVTDSSRSSAQGPFHMARRAGSHLALRRPPIHP